MGIDFFFYLGLIFSSRRTRTAFSRSGCLISCLNSRSCFFRFSFSCCNWMFCCLSVWTSAFGIRMAIIVTFVMVGDGSLGWCSGFAFLVIGWL